MKFIGVVGMGFILIGVPTGCGKKVVRGVAGSETQHKPFMVKQPLSNAWPDISMVTHGKDPTDSSQEIDNQTVRTEKINEIDLFPSSSNAGARKGKAARLKNTSMGGGKDERPTSGGPFVSSRRDSHEEDLRSSSRIVNREKREMGDFSASSSSEERVAKDLLAQKNQRKGVTFSNGLQDIYFEFDSWRLNEESRKRLEANAAWLKAHPHERITIEGHCDERGTRAYNYVLGEKRATMVQQYLSFLGVPHHQLIVTSYGKDRPLCRGFSEECFQENRRAHFVSDVNVAVSRGQNN